LLIPNQDTNMAADTGNILRNWNPEDPKTWDKGLAWRTVWISTFSLTLGFCAWFIVPALAPRLDSVGFDFTHRQLYWLVAMVGLSAGTLRIFWTFLPPILGTRLLVVLSTILLVIPLVGWAFAVQDPRTPYWVLLLLGVLSGIGGGSFSGLMASTSYFFPKHEKGTALAVQGGISDFGTSLVQFVTPWVIGFSILAVLGGPQAVHHAGGETRAIWLQNAAWVYVPFVIVVALAAWAFLRSVPIHADLRQQWSIFGSKHTWFMTLFYYGTFATFAGLGAQMALLGRDMFSAIPGAPNAVAYAFLGPLVGSVSRVLAGPAADKFRGGRVTTIMGVLTLAGLVFLWWYRPTAAGDFWIWLAAMLWVFFWTGVGNASTTKQMAVLFPPMQAGGVVGWTSAIGAYGPFTFGLVLAEFSPAVMFATSIAVFVAILAVNWTFYDRPGAPDRC
jgi:NNP family nitrate/nitrite transporter-like MFS transporter